MEKVSFALNVEKDWPPVAIEHVWCERRGTTYELQSAPFFIEGLAWGDKFSAEKDAVNGCIFDFVVVETSGHSLVWVVDDSDEPGLKLQDHKAEFLSLGARIEGFPRFGLHAIDIPAAVDSTSAMAAMKRLEELGFCVDYPIWRH